MNKPEREAFALSAGLGVARGAGDFQVECVLFFGAERPPFAACHCQRTRTHLEPVHFASALEVRRAARVVCSTASTNQLSA